LGAKPKTHPLAHVEGAVVERELGGEGKFGDGSNFDLLGFERDGSGGVHSGCGPEEQQPSNSRPKQRRPNGHPASSTE